MEEEARSQASHILPIQGFSELLIRHEPRHCALREVRLQTSVQVLVEGLAHTSVLMAWKKEEKAPSRSITPWSSKGSA